MFTLAITEDGSQVFGWGEADHCAFGSRDITGDHFQPVVSQGSVEETLFSCDEGYLGICMMASESPHAALVYNVCSCWHT